MYMHDRGLSAKPGIYSRSALFRPAIIRILRVYPFRINTRAQLYYNHIRFFQCFRALQDSVYFLLLLLLLLLLIILLLLSPLLLKNLQSAKVSTP